jgi:hypothetical protein
MLVLPEARFYVRIQVSIVPDGIIFTPFLVNEYDIAVLQDLHARLEQLQDAAFANPALPSQHNDLPFSKRTLYTVNIFLPR